MGNVFTKSPSALLDYGVDWGDWLEADADTITAASWTAISPSGGLVESSSSFNTTTATIWLNSGCANVDYRFYNRIITACARNETREMIIRVRTR